MPATETPYRPCKICGKAIPAARLQASPRSLTCSLECAKRNRQNNMNARGREYRKRNRPIRATYHQGKRFVLKMPNGENKEFDPTLIPELHDLGERLLALCKAQERLKETQGTQPLTDAKKAP